MYGSFAEIRRKASGSSPRTLVVASAADEQVLISADRASSEGMVECVLVGDRYGIEQAADRAGISLARHRIVEAGSHEEACERAVELATGANMGTAGPEHRETSRAATRTPILMKGVAPTPVFLKAVLAAQKLTGEKTFLSHVGIFEVSSYHKLVYVTDAGLNPEPDFEEKIKIVRNAVELVSNLGVEKPKVAMLGAVETVSPKMKASIESAAIAKMGERGQIKGAIIDGPLALDNAINLESARHKGIESPVAGDADILVVPQIEAGNILAKSLMYFAGARMAGLVVGASYPIVVTSRSEPAEGRLTSIAAACLVG